MAVNNPHGHNQYTDKKKMENADPSKRSSPSSAGASRSGDQHAEAGRQSHKSDDKSSSSQAGRQAGAEK